MLTLELLDRPGRVWASVSWACVALLSFGLYLQHGVGLVPCPMCIVQRYVMVLIAVVAGVGALLPGRQTCLGVGGLTTVLGASGAYVAARQSWLQWYPPEVVSCGRDFYGMIETFPLQRAIPMIFKGGGDCSAVDWTLLGGSIANWSFLCFLGIALLALVTTVRLLRSNDPLKAANDASFDA